MNEPIDWKARAERAEAELERLRKQNAVKDAALNQADLWFFEMGWAATGDNRKIIRQAIGGDAAS